MCLLKINAFAQQIFLLAQMRSVFLEELIGALSIFTHEMIIFLFSPKTVAFRQTNRHI